MRVADFIFKFIADLGVKDVFMLSGGGAMFLNDALGSEKRLRYICTHHEQGAAIAAEGYSRVTGGLAVVSVTTGPGGTNSLTGVIGEWLDSLPVLYISGQVKFATTIASAPELPLRQLGDQEINIVDIVKPVTKYAVMVTQPDKIRYELEKAVWLATHGRPGPVWLDIPINVQSQDINPDELTGYVPTTDQTPSFEIGKVISALMQSQKPLIVAGHGIRLAGAIKDFKKLVEKWQIPVVGTLNGFDLLPSDSPYNIGRIGTIGTRAANIALQNADFVLCIGTRNNIRQISYNWENFAKRANSLIIVDIDPAELAKQTLKPTSAIHADAKDFIRACLNDNQPIPDFTSWLKWNQERCSRYPTVLNEYRNLKSGIQPYLFMEKLTQALPDNAIIACTNATPSLALFQAGIVKNSQRMFVNSGCAAMGFGLPASLGSAVAANGRPVICLEGDGSLMMNLQELQTIKFHNLPIKLFLFSNNEYSSIRQTQDNFFEGRKTGCTPESGVTFPDWDKLAAAFGWKYFNLSKESDITDHLEEILALNEPVFCELKLVPGYTFSPKLSSRKLPDGTLVSSSLEDMYPFLPEEEMKGNIYV